MKKVLALAFAFTLVAGSSCCAFADESPGTAAKIDAIQHQLDTLKAQLDELKAQQGSAASGTGPAASKSAPVAATGGTPVVLKSVAKPGDPFTLQFGKEAVTFYGNLDVSFDVSTKGLANYYPSSGDSPVGQVGWQPDISTNLSYFGVKGQHNFSNNSFAVYQLETQLDISATSGTVNTNSTNDSTVKGALTSRNSFIGVGNKYVGALKIGKTDAPYKTSTARMNPFSGELGDNSVIMGNSGGDNRVEFGTRLDHSIWYESPIFGGGFSTAILASPGQNRAGDNSTEASGESSCTGGQAPGAGAETVACNDGSFGSAYSASVAYQRSKLYLTGAYELHKNVNRVSDLGNSGEDIGDESAIKGGFQYAFTPRTTVSAFYEDLERFVPYDIEYQNERSRSGFWIAVTQFLHPYDSINFGWGRANPSPGDPGQHNTPAQANPDNMANLYTFAYKRALDAHVSWYADYAATINHPDAHYDLGAGGRGVTTDCHDGSEEAAFDVTSGTVSGGGPHCYAGGHLQGFSAGLDVRF